MTSNFICHKISTPITNKITQELNSLSSENSLNSHYNINSNKIIKPNIFTNTISLNKNNQNQSTFAYNHLSKLIQPDKLKNFYHFYEKENSKKLETNYSDVFNNNNIIELKDLIGKNSKRPIEINMLSEPIPKLSQGKISSKSFGIITSYAANTHQGIVRNYNEDRVSIIINMNKISNYKNTKPWPKISYFAIFDGHAGNKCAEYLRENLLKLICSNKYFPDSIPEAIKFGFEKADEYFLNNYAMINGQLKDNSGTCGLILLIVNNDVYIGNVGDSRCIGSFNKGKIQRDITRDHKPNTPYEKERIMANGGQIYQTKTNIKIEENFILRTKILLGPYRVFPGRLSVSRTIGDAEGKIPSIGGNPNVIICKPDIYKFNILENDIDYFVLGCDGIFDQMSSEDVFKCVSLVIERNKEILEKKNKYDSLYGNNIDIHTTSGDIVDLILKGAMLRQSYDNVTCLLVSFKNLLNTDFIFLNKNNNNINNNIREKYLTKNKDSKIILSSNSTSDYLKNNNKKNINIHEINKFMQKLKSSGSDSELIKKKEELTETNKIKEYSSKPLMNFYIKTYNKYDNKYLQTSIPNVNDNNSNPNMSLTFGNEKKMKEKKKFQIIYKNNNIRSNILLNNKENKTELFQNERNTEEKSDSNPNSEEKNKQIFYNKKKIYFSGLKKNEPCDSKKKEETQKIDMNNINKNRSIRIIDTRNKDKKSHKIVSNLIINNNINNNSSKYLSGKDTSYTLGNININNQYRSKFISSSLKKPYNNKTKENDLLKKDTEYEVNTNNFTDQKIKSNKIFNDIIKNKTNQFNLIKNFNDIYQNSVNNSNEKVPTNNTNYKSSNINKKRDENIINHNTSYHTFKPIISQSLKKKNTSYKIAIKLNDKESNIITEYNNINKEPVRYYFYKNTNNSTNYLNNNNSYISNKYDSFINKYENKISHQKKEPKNNDSMKNWNYNHEMKNKNSQNFLRSNTEINYYKDKKYQ